MFRYIIIPLVLILLWPVYKVFLPDSVRSFGFVNTISAIMYPYEEVVYENIAELDKNRFNSQIISADLNVLNATMGKVRGQGNRSLLIYLYEPDCFKCRTLLGTINEIAEENSNVKFLVVAFDDDKITLNNLLNNFEALYFKPILSSKSNYTNFKSSVAPDDGEINEVPSIIIYSSQSSTAQSVTPNLFIKNNILRLIK